MLQLFLSTLIHRTEEEFSWIHHFFCSSFIPEVPGFLLFSRHMNIFLSMSFAEGLLAVNSSFISFNYVFTSFSFLKSVSTLEL